MPAVRRLTLTAMLAADVAGYSSRTVSRTKCAMCPAGTKSCTEAGNSHTSSTSHGRKTLLMPSSGSNYQRSVHGDFCYYPDRLLGQGACPIAFWAGDLDAAERYGTMLLDHTERHPIRLWHVWARCFNGLVTAKRGDIDTGLRALRGGLEEAGEARFLPRFLLLLGELAMLLGEVGRGSQRWTMRLHAAKRATNSGTWPSCSVSMAN